MEIFNPKISKKEKVRNLRLKRFDLPGEDGEIHTFKVVEFTVIGNTREWKDFIKYDDFCKFNSDKVREVGIIR